MGKIGVIKNEDMVEALKSTTRQYFVGNLKKPQQVTFFKDERLEIGFSCYDKDTYEPAHVHSLATEYQYMVDGYTEYMDVDTNEVYKFKKGDFYVIEQNTKYLQKVNGGTKIIFIKVPSINDKTLVDITDEQKEWLKNR